MPRHVALAVLVLAVITPTPAVGGGNPHTPLAASESDALTVEAPTSSAGEPALLALYPNPVADHDRGEFVLLRGGGATNVTLTDGEDRIDLPALPAGRVAITADPARVRNLTEYAVVAVPTLGLANGGEEVRLRRDGRVLDVLTYTDASEGERLVRTTGGPVWQPLGLSPRDAHRFGPTNATAFVLPDAPRIPIETVRDARSRILLAGYTFTSERVASALAAAARRGVRVRVLVEARPVDGIVAREAAVLDRLVDAGVEVSVTGAGPRARFAFHHPKYAVVDDRVLVLTENWKPAGTGGRSSRGWGIRIASAAVAADLAELFRGDASARDVQSWRQFRRGRRFESKPVADGTYPSRFDPAQVSVERTAVLSAPGNAAGAVVELLESADERIAVVQPTVSRESALLQATLAAAARGVRVRLLLSGAWYVAEENRAIAARLNERAEERDLALEVRVAEPGGRFEKIHAKGVIADQTVVLGSLNWNPMSARENREVALALYGPDVAAYYREVFLADWRGGRTRTPVGYLLAVAVAAALAIYVLSRRVRFGRP